MSIRFFCFLLFFLYATIQSQQINGIVNETNGSPLVFGNVTFQELGSKNINEIALIQNGKFSKKLEKKYNNILLVIRSQQYEDIKDTIHNISMNAVIDKKYILIKKRIFEIEEVVLKKDLKKIDIKQDTVTYNVTAYKDGSEKKLEDILKKLPGIEVNEKSGEIKYKGKSIEALNIEGDNLFGKNYTLGSRNINLDIIDKIEAIENYSDNPLLKGLENQEKVALNIKLKKGKIDFSGNIDYASGFSNEEEVYNTSTNILAINKKIKSFNTLSYNNVGVNNTPFDYFSSVKSVEQISDEQYYAKKNIAESSNNTALDDIRVNNNNLFFVNHNSIVKLNDKTNLRSNLYFLEDKISQESSFENSVNFDDTSFTTFDKYYTLKTPKQYRADFLIKYNPNKKSLYEYNIQFSNENILTNSLINQNNLFNYSTSLESKSTFVNQNFLITKRLNEKKALQINFVHSFNEIPQNLIFNPSILADSTSQINYQSSTFSKSVFNLNTTLVGLSKKNNKYAIQLGGSVEKTPFESFTKGNLDSNFSEENKNDIVYNKHYFYSSVLYQINYNKYKITPSLKLTYLSQALDSPNISNHYFLYEPTLKIIYGINNYSFISATINHNQVPFSEEYLFSNSVFINNRYSISNKPSLNIQKNTSFHLAYYLNNLYEQFQLNFGIDYSINNGDYFNKINISENRTSIERFYLESDSKRLGFHFMSEKYISLLQSTISVSSNANINSFKNIVNNSDLRDVTSTNINNSLSIKTAFDFKINFDNTFSYNINMSSFDDASPIKNKSIINNFKIILKPFRKFIVIADSQYLIPNISKKKEHYFFIDFSAKYNLNKKLELSVFAKNILNYNQFVETDISDYSKSLLSNNLIPRYYMLNISYNF